MDIDIFPYFDGKLYFIYIQIITSEKMELVTDNRNYPVLPRVIMKCHHCGRVMALKNFKEGELLDKVEQDKYYI